MQRKPHEREDIVAPQMTSNETWNDCPDCGKAWKDEVSTPGLIHRTRLCNECYKKRKQESE